MPARVIRGIANAKQTAKLTAEALGVNLDEVLVMSTGVIGTQLPMDKIANGVHTASATLGEATGLRLRKRL